MLSVIVPIYNVETYLPKCIESILAQTYKQLEIILVNDGSTDSCPKICDDYAKLDNRIKVIHQSNEGLVRARKSGLNKSRSDYITFVDGDDWIEPDMYLKMMNTIESVNADFADSGYFCDKEEISNIERILEENVYELDDLTRHKCFLSLLDLQHSIKMTASIWSKIFKADIIKSSYAKVPDSMQYGEDIINILYCILSAVKIVQVKDIYYHYRYREKSLSHLKSPSFMRKELMLWNYCGNIILNNDKFITQEDMDHSLFRKEYSAISSIMAQEFDAIQYYSFPYIEKLYGKKLIIYGAGRVGKEYISQISKYEKCEIVCWVDKEYEKIQLRYREVVSIEDIKKKTYDFILIAVEKKEMADEIRCQLIEKGVPEEKILWYKPNTIF